jgi:hypothetical protein
MFFLHYRYPLASPLMKREVKVELIETISSCRQTHVCLWAARRDARPSNLCACAQERSSSKEKLLRNGFKEMCSRLSVLCYWSVRSGPWYDATRLLIPTCIAISSPMFHVYFVPCKVPFRKWFQIKMAVFWVVAPCSLVEVYRHFRGACCFHHQDDETSVNFY